MKKFFSLMLLMVAATVGLQSQAAMWLVGDAFNGWNESGNVQMTQNGDIYSYTAEVGANVYFAFFKDSEGWNYQRGPARGNDSAPTGDWEATTSGGAWKIAAAGTYTFEYNYSTDQARIVANSVVEPDPFDADALTFVATGDAVGGWTMPPTVLFTKNADGTHSLEINASAAEFKIAGVKDPANLSWGDFDAGVYGGATLALGDNTLTAGQTANMSMPQAGLLVLTVSDVTEASCKLNITVKGEAEKAYYLIGSFNTWDDSTKEPFQLMDDGSFQLQRSLEAGAEFKIKDENGAWLGGDTQGQSDLFELKADFNVVELSDSEGAKNFVINEAGDFTFFIKDGYLTVTGWSEQPQPENTMYLLGNVAGEWDPSIGQPLENSNDEMVFHGGLTAADSGDGYAYFGFTRKLGASWDAIAADRVGPVSEGDFELLAEQIGSPISMQQPNENAFKVPAGSELTFALDTRDMTITFYGDIAGGQELELASVQIVGSYDENWTTTETFDLVPNEQTGKYELADQVLDNGFEFKVVATYNDQSQLWLSPASDGKFLVNEGQLGNELALAEGNPNLYFEKAGKFSFAVTPDLNTLVITGEFEAAPEPALSDVRIVGSYQADWSELVEVPLTLNEQTGKYEAADEQIKENYEFKVVATYDNGDKKWLAPASDGRFLVNEDQLGNELALGEENANNMYFEKAGTFSFAVAADLSSLVINGQFEEQPEVQLAQVMIIGSYDENWENKEEYELALTNGDGYVLADQAIDNGFEFKVVARYTDQSEKWLSPASEGNFLVNQEQLGNALALAEGNPNLYFENPGTFTFKVAEDLSSLVINGQFEEQPEPDKAYYLTGSFNNWNQSEEDEVIAFELQEDGSFKVERSLEAGAEFKIKDEKGTWLGGDTQGQSDLFELKADFNVVELSDSEGAKNFVINQAGDYTFAIKDGYLTVTGWSEQPEVQLAQVMIIGSYDENWENKEEYELALTNGDGYVLADQAIDNGFEFKVVARYTDQSEKWLSPASEGNFLVNQEQLGNALALAEGNPNLYFENPGTFTFKVAEDLSSLVINGQFEEQPDKAYYLTGSFNNWNQSEEDEVIAFELQEDGSFKVERSLEAGAEFKIKDEKGTWLGGDTQGQSDLFELKADFNVVELSDSEGAKNFVINQAGDYTFAIKDGYLTVTGWGEQPIVAATAWIKGATTDDWAEPIEFELTLGEDGQGVPQWQAREIEIPDAFQFKIVKRVLVSQATDDTYYGAEAEEGTFHWVTEDQLGQPIALFDEGSKNLYFEKGGKFDFVVSEDFSSLVITGESQPQPDITYYLTGSFNNWNQSEQDELVAFQPQEDGSYKVEHSLEAGAEFKIVDTNRVWYGGDTQGQSETFELKADFNVVQLSTSEGAKNFIINQAGDYTFAIKDGYLTVTGWGEQPEPEHSYYLTGTFNNWNQSEQDEVIAFEPQQDGSYKVEHAIEAGAEFKIKDEKGTWLGGDTQGQSDLFELKADFNVVELSDSEGAKNFVINEAGNFTFTIKDGYLTVTGWGGEVPAAPIYVLGNCQGDWDPTVGLAIQPVEDLESGGYAYKAEIEIVDSGDGYGYFAFSRKLAADNEGWDEINQYRFGPQSDGDFEVNESVLGIDINMVDGLLTAFKAPAGMQLSIEYIENSHILHLNGLMPQPTVYVIGHIEGTGFEPDLGVLMTTGDGITYEAVINVDDIQDGGWFAFTTKLASKGADEGGWEEIAPYRFTAVSEGDYVVEPKQYGKPISLTEVGDPAAQEHSIKLPAGEWNLIVNMEARTLVVNSTRNPYDVNNDGAVDVGDVNMILAAILDNNNDPTLDVNHDGAVDVGDVNMILAYILENS